VDRAAPGLIMLKVLLAAAVACGISAAFAQGSSTQTAPVALKALLDDDLANVFRRFPLYATVRGIPGYDHLLPDLSFTTLAKEQARERSMVARLKEIDAKALQGQDRVSYELLLEKMENAVEAQRFPKAEHLVLSTFGGVQSAMPYAAEVIALRTADNYRDYIKRLNATPKAVDETIERLRAGLKSGWMSPVPVIDRVVASIDAHVVDNVDDSVLLKPLKKFGPGVPESERAALAAAARRAVAEDYQPALRRFKAFIVDEYRPKAPRVAGLAALPGGAEYYEFLIRTRVVRGMTTAQIHDLGLRQVERLRNEIGAIAKRTGFSGTTDEFIEQMRTDPKFFFTSPDAVLAAYREVGTRVDPQLPRLFHAIPRMPYAVRAMTPSESVSSTAANYTVGSLKLGTPGYFTINALGYKNEATWRTETLFVHELVPGHHMQIARATEVEGLHPWRSMGSYNSVYGEGWALYAETLGFDLGLYKDPYQHYGHLQAQLFRAARLVVDTGIHAYNWPRDKAIAYMGGQGGVDQDFAVSEVDRYFSNPSQALGYMLGQLKFLELRARAEKALGPRFDVRDFHAVVIESGSVPLAVLEKLVDEWIAARKA
jgi:uncharacterized protein (DUF885 family)